MAGSGRIIMSSCDVGLMSELNQADDSQARKSVAMAKNAF